MSKGWIVPCVDSILFQPASSFLFTVITYMPFLSNPSHLYPIHESSSSLSLPYPSLSLSRHATPECPVVVGGGNVNRRGYLCFNCGLGLEPPHQLRSNLCENSSSTSSPGGTWSPGIQAWNSMENRQPLSRASVTDPPHSTQTPGKMASRSNSGLVVASYSCCGICCCWCWWWWQPRFIPPPRPWTFIAPPFAQTVRAVVMTPSRYEARAIRIQTAHFRFLFSRRVSFSFRSKSSSDFDSASSSDTDSSSGSVSVSGARSDGQRNGSFSSSYFSIDTLIFAGAGMGFV